MFCRSWRGIFEGAEVFELFDLFSFVFEVFDLFSFVFEQSDLFSFVFEPLTSASNRNRTFDVGKRLCGAGIEPAPFGKRAERANRYATLPSVVRNYVTYINLRVKNGAWKESGVDNPSRTVQALEHLPKLQKVSEERLPIASKPSLHRRTH